MMNNSVHFWREESKRGEEGIDREGSGLEFSIRDQGGETLAFHLSKPSAPLHTLRQDSWQCSFKPGQSLVSLAKSALGSEEY